jgi:hypothetical protein
MKVVTDIFSGMGDQKKSTSENDYEGHGPVLMKYEVDAEARWFFTDLGSCRCIGHRTRRLRHRLIHRKKTVQRLPIVEGLLLFGHPKDATPTGS